MTQCVEEETRLILQDEQVEIRRQENMQYLQDNLQNIRGMLGLTQEEISNAIGIKRQYLSAIERKDRNLTTPLYYSILFLLYTIHNKLKESSLTKLTLQQFFKKINIEDIFSIKRN